MRVISVPGKLRLASALFLLAVPAMAIETVIVSRAPWWKLPVHSMEVWAAVIAAVALPLSLFMQAGKKWAFSIGIFLSASWIAISIWLAIRAQQPALGFFTCFLIVFFGGALSWLNREMTRSYFDPQIQWFQRLPKPIPGLSCWVSRETDSWDMFRVSRIDEEGVFLFRDGGAGAQFSRKDRLALKFVFRDRKIQAVGVPIRDLREGLGVGVQFKGLEADSYKEIGDFVELLRGEGYVA
jgi:hypothetical protein